MNFMLIPALIFFAIELVAFSNGETHLATLACGGVLLCCGINAGWHMWGRSNGKKEKDVKDR